MVSKILSEIGYTCEIEKNIQTTRETVNVDVFAINVKENPNTCIICEWKYWSKSIPKTVIHSFRTIIAIISCEIERFIYTLKQLPLRNGFDNIIEIKTEN